MPWQSTDAGFFRRIPSGTLRVRLTLLNTAAVLLAVMVLLIAVRIGFRRTLVRDTDDTLLGEVREVALALQELGPDLSLLIDELRRKAEGHYDRDWFVQLLDGPNSTVWASDNCPDVVRIQPIDETVAETVTEFAGYRWARCSVIANGQKPKFVRIGLSNAVIDRDIDAVTWFLIPIGLAFTLLTPLAGYWLALRATRPISGILRTADRLKPTKLGDRLETRGTNDELDRLSATINRLLDQVARHVERQQQFVADAAHELRGPLAAMQNSLEVATSKCRSVESYQATLEDVLGETRQLSKLANDLLLLAEVGNSLGSLFNESIDIDLLVKQTVAMFAGVAEERSIQLAVAGSANVEVRGDMRQVRQVLSNLVDNAIRFTGAGGKVEIAASITPGSGMVTITVVDNGRGIDPDHIDRVFDRFFQADAARDRGDIKRGGGLGLSICRSIIERHGGRISLASPGIDRGTTVTVQLPLRVKPA
jgi:hypothetical protein